jgi:hypothetical protein
VLIMDNNRGRSKAEKAKAEKAENIRNYSKLFDADSEEVATAYKNFKSPKDPDIKTIRAGLAKGDKSARDAVERANAIGDSLVYNPKKDPNFRSIKEGVPSDIADQLQTSRNERAAKAYDKRRSEGQDYKKGGMVKSKSSASKRADGCAVRGKTRA